MDALVLAGSLNTGSLRQCSQVENEALIPIGDKAMVEYVVEAVRQSAHIDQVILVGSPERFRPLFGHQAKIKYAPGGETVIQGVLNGLQEATVEKYVLIVSSDIPLLTTEAVDQFIEACLEYPDRQLFYPIVAKDVNDRHYPGVKRTYVKLKDGIFTGGNLFLVEPEIVPRCAAKAEEIISLRKSPLALARLIGLGFIVKLLLRLVSVAEAERRVSQLLGVSGKAIITPYPEIGIDVDKPSDLELVRRVLVQQ